MNLKGPKILGTSYGANFEKQRKHRETQKLSRIGMATLIAVSLQLNGMLIMWKIQQAMGRCRSGRQNSSRFHPGNRAEVFIWSNHFKKLYRDPGWKNGDVGNRASPPCHMKTSKIL